MTAIEPYFGREVFFFEDGQKYGLVPVPVDVIYSAFALSLATEVSAVCRRSLPKGWL